MNKRILTISVIIFSCALYLQLFPRNETVPLKKAFAGFPLAWKGWNGRVAFFDDTVIDKLGVSEYLIREYRKGSDRVVLYVGYYGSQKKGAQIHSPKHCLPGSGWFRLSEKKNSLTIEGMGKISYVETVYQKDREKEIFIYWYKMKNEYITSEYVLKLYMILNSLRYGRNEAAFVRISEEITENEENSLNSIKEFMKDFLPLLKDYLPE